MTYVKRAKWHLDRSVTRALGVAGTRPVQPAQFFYLERENLAFLIISKNGCSAVKESLISSVLGDVDLPFEKVHHFFKHNRQELESRGLTRYFFSETPDISSFLAGKTLLVFERSVLSRVHSVYKDYKTGKNKMIFPVFPRYSLTKRDELDWTLDQFCEVISGIGDSLADRHYRSQTAFWDAIPESCELIRLDLRDMQNQFASHPLLSSLPAPRRRNVGSTTPDDPMSTASVELMRTRYAQDLEFGIPFEN